MNPNFFKRYISNLYLYLFFLIGLVGRLFTGNSYTIFFVLVTISTLIIVLLVTRRQEKVESQKGECYSKVLKYLKNGLNDKLSNRIKKLGILDDMVLFISSFEGRLDYKQGNSSKDYLMLSSLTPTSEDKFKIYLRLKESDDDESLNIVLFNHNSYCNNFLKQNIYNDYKKISSDKDWNQIKSIIKRELA